MPRFTVLAAMFAVLVGLTACTVRPQGQGDVIEDYDDTFKKGPGVFTGRSGKLSL